MLTLIMMTTAAAIEPGADAPAFELKDVNPASATHGEMVSPGDYLGKRSAWYFGHAT